MDNESNTEISVEEIMRRIKDEVARRQSSPAGGRLGESFDFHGGRAFHPVVVQETWLFRFMKKVQALISRLPFYLWVYAIAVKLKKFIPHYYEVLTLRDFYKNENEVFVDSVYKMILKREPDLHAREYFLSRLRDGRMSKIEVIGRIRYSREGRHSRVKIPGLFPRFVLHCAYRAPLVGTLLRKLTTEGKT